MVCTKWRISAFSPETAILNSLPQVVQLQLCSVCGSKLQIQFGLRYEGEHG